MRRLRRLAALLLCLGAPVRPLAAQTTYATITGTVTDPSGGVVQGAEVSARGEETKVVTRTRSNAQGVYTVGQLREGTYVLAVSAPGFREFAATDLVLSAREIRRLD